MTCSASDSLASTSWCRDYCHVTSTLGLSNARDKTQGFVHARQTHHPLSSTSGLYLVCQVLPLHPRELNAFLPEMFSVPLPKCSWMLLGASHRPACVLSHCSPWELLLLCLWPLSYLTVPVLDTHVEGRFPGPQQFSSKFLKTSQQLKICTVFFSSTVSRILTHL